MTDASVVVPLARNFQEDLLNSRRFPVFLGVAETLILLHQNVHCEPGLVGALGYLPALTAHHSDVTYIARMRRRTALQTWLFCAASWCTNHNSTWRKSLYTHSHMSDNILLSWWHGSATGRALDSRSVGRGFKSFSRQRMRNNLGQVVHTYVPLSPSSITWYQPKRGDALWLGR